MRDALLMRVSCPYSQVVILLQATAARLRAQDDGGGVASVCSRSYANRERRQYDRTKLVYRNR